MTDRGGGALLLPSMPAGLTGSDDDDVGKRKEQKTLQGGIFLFLSPF